MYLAVRVHKSSAPCISIRQRRAALAPSHMCSQWIQGHCACGYVYWYCEYYTRHSGWCSSASRVSLCARTFWYCPVRNAYAAREQERRPLVCRYLIFRQWRCNRAISQLKSEIHLRNVSKFKKVSLLNAKVEQKINMMSRTFPHVIKGVKQTFICIVWVWSNSNINTYIMPLIVIAKYVLEVFRNNLSSSIFLLYKEHKVHFIWVTFFNWKLTIYSI